MVNISQYSVVLLDDPRHPDTFQLTDDTRGEPYSEKLLVLALFQMKSNIFIYLFILFIYLFIY